MKNILLSFDIEEFEMPFEYGEEISFDNQIQISTAGAEKILDLLKKRDIKATFYTTANFGQHAQQIVDRIVQEGHELASHGLFHNNFETKDLAESKRILENISGVEVRGYRMARMKSVSEKDILAAGYVYNSSLNPTFLPGRYNNLKELRTISFHEGMWRLPASVTPTFRIPLFWLSFHNFPLWIYRFLSKKVLNKDGYLNIYFHPWEFMPIGPKSKYNFPSYVTRNTGHKMEKRFEGYLDWAIKEGFHFMRTIDFITKKNENI